MKTVERAMEEATPTRTIKKEQVKWMTAEIRRERRERNRLRRDINNNREEWKAKCKKVRDLEVEAKRRIWREKLEGIQEAKDAGKVWGIVKSLGAPERAARSEVLVYRGKNCVTDRAKANAFIQEYAEYSLHVLLHVQSVPYFLSLVLHAGSNYIYYTVYMLIWD